METYCGHVKTPADAIQLFEACRLGHLPRVQRRLSEKERSHIKSGSVFVWDEREAGMRRWTDGKSWSASRVSGSFLTYREMEGKRGGPSSNPFAARQDGRTPTGESDSEGVDTDGPDGYRYKPDGLMKQSFSITTTNGDKLHLISYYSRNHPDSHTLKQPTQDPALQHIRPVRGMYPESTCHEQQNVPVVTRTPLASALQPNPPIPAYPHGVMTYSVPYQWPLTPLMTPPPNVHAYPGYHPHGLVAIPHAFPPIPVTRPDSGGSSPYPAYAYTLQPPPLLPSGSPHAFYSRPQLPPIPPLPSPDNIHVFHSAPPPYSQYSPGATHAHAYRLTPPFPSSNSDANERPHDDQERRHSPTVVPSEPDRIEMRPLFSNNDLPGPPPSLTPQDITGTTLRQGKDMEKRSIKALDRGFDTPRAAQW